MVGKLSWYIFLNKNYLVFTIFTITPTREKIDLLVNLRIAKLVLEKRGAEESVAKKYVTTLLIYGILNIRPGKLYFSK